MIFHYSIINTSKGMKKRALCPLSGVHLTIKPRNAIFDIFLDINNIYSNYSQMFFFHRELIRRISGVLFILL